MTSRNPDPAQSSLEMSLRSLYADARASETLKATVARRIAARASERPPQPSKRRNFWPSLALTGAITGIAVACYFAMQPKWRDDPGVVARIRATLFAARTIEWSTVGYSQPENAASSPPPPVSAFGHVYISRDLPGMRQEAANTSVEVWGPDGHILARRSLKPHRPGKTSETWHYHYYRPPSIYYTRSFIGYTLFLPWQEISFEDNSRNDWQVKDETEHGRKLHHLRLELSQKPEAGSRPKRYEIWADATTHRIVRTRDTSYVRLSDMISNASWQEYRNETFDYVYDPPLSDNLFRLPPDAHPASTESQTKK